MKNNNYYDVRQITDLKDLIVGNGEVHGPLPAFLVKKEKGGEYFEISHEKFRDDVNALGEKLLEMGLKDKKIAIIGTNSYQWLLSYFSIVNGVGVAVPLDKELKDNEIYNLIEQAECDAIFYSKEYADEVLSDECKVKYKFEINPYEEEKDEETENHIKKLVKEGYQLIEEGKTEFKDIQIDPDQMAVILFTSGTTGAAKGVMLSHKNIVKVILATNAVEDFSYERSLSVLPIHHTFESSSVMVILHQGGSIAFFEGLKYVLKNLQESKASMVVGVPLIIESIYNKIWTQAKKSGKEKMLKKAIKLHKGLKKIGIDQRRKIFSSVYKSFGGELKMFLSGAAALNPATARGLMDLGFEVLQGYGLTECAPLVTATPMYEDRYHHAGSCGMVIPGSEIKVINKDDEGIGEICYKGDNVMLGYYKMPEETDKVIIDGWFHTGDLGFVDQNGWVYLTGRQKNVIVTKTGKNIYPEEIEVLVNKIKFVNESMVYGLEFEEDASKDTVVSVQILPDFEAIKEEFGEDLSNEKLTEMFKNDIKELNESLATYKRIRNVIVRDTDFVRTTTKKIKRQANI